MQGNAGDGMSSARGGRGAEIVIEIGGGGGGGRFLMAFGQLKSCRDQKFAIIAKFMPGTTMQIKKQNLK